MFLLAFLQSCKDCKNESKFSCLQDISITGTHDLGTVTIQVPGEDSYTNLGALPAQIKIGNYTGNMRSVIVKQWPADDNGVVFTELRHHFDDGKGNQFWTHDYARVKPVPGSQTQLSVDDDMYIRKGTGDFACATGRLKNIATMDLATSKLTVNTTGEICWGCE